MNTRSMTNGGRGAAFTVLRARALVAACAALCAGPSAGAITADALGPMGEGGTLIGREITVGPGGRAYEMDAFVAVAGMDLNGTAAGTTARLSRDPLPAGLACAFASETTAGGGTLVLRYTFTNGGPAQIAGLRFFYLLDVEIDQAANTFFNEYGVMTGNPGTGLADEAPDSWAIDEPGFTPAGSLGAQLADGALVDANRVPEDAPDDVAMAIGFALGDLEPASDTWVEIHISEIGQSVGGVALIQRDTAPGSTTEVTLSGVARPQEIQEVYEEVTSRVDFSLAWQLSFRTGTLFGTLTLRNPAASGVRLSQMLHLAIQPSTTTRFMAPDGTLANGQAYLDLTDLFLAALAQTGNRDAVLDPGETIVLGSGTAADIDLYSRNRVAPPTSMFAIWSVSSGGSADGD